MSGATAVGAGVAAALPALSGDKVTGYALPACAKQQRRTAHERQSVVIIGGGLAGLQAGSNCLRAF